MTTFVNRPGRVVAADTANEAAMFVDPDHPPLPTEPLQRWWARSERAEAIIRQAGSDSPDSMRQRGWYQSSNVLPADQALAEAEISLRYGDYPVRATRTRGGFILWKTRRRS